jgi:hypothetical protein
MSSISDKEHCVSGANGCVLCVVQSNLAVIVIERRTGARWPSLWAAKEYCVIHVSAVLNVHVSTEASDGGNAR